MGPSVHFSWIRAISISRCDGVVDFEAVVNVFNSLVVITVPDKCDAWLKYGRLRILVVSNSHVRVHRSLRVTDLIRLPGK